MCTRVRPATSFRNPTSRPMSVVPASTMHPTFSAAAALICPATSATSFSGPVCGPRPPGPRTFAHSNDRCSWNSVAVVPSDAGATSASTVRITGPPSRRCAKPKPTPAPAARTPSISRRLTTLGCLDHRISSSVTFSSHFVSPPKPTATCTSGLVGVAPCDVRAWDEVAVPLARAGHRVLMPYLRGYGPTPIPRRRRAANGGASRDRSGPRRSRRRARSRALRRRGV